VSDKVTPETVFDHKAFYKRLTDLTQMPPDSSNEHLTNDEIFDYALERLSTDETGRIDAHLRGCEVCLNDMEMVLEIFNPWVGEMVVTPELLVSLGIRLADRTWNIRASAAAVVAALGPVAATAKILRGLLKLLEDDREWMRQSAVEAFRGLGVAGRSAEVSKALDAMLRHLDFKVRSAATAVVRGFNEVEADDGRIGGAPASKVDGGHLDRPRRSVLRYRATAERLGELASFLSSAEDMERAAAVRVVVALGGAAAEPNFMQTLMQLLQDENDETRFVAIEAIEAIGPAAAWPDFVSGCRSLLRSDKSSVSEAAAQIIRSLGSAARLESMSSGSMIGSRSGASPVAGAVRPHEPVRFVAKGKLSSTKPAQEVAISGTIFADGRSMSAAQLHLKSGGEVLLVTQGGVSSERLILEIAKARIDGMDYPLKPIWDIAIMKELSAFDSPVVWVVSGLRWKKAKAAFEAAVLRGKDGIEIHLSGIDGR
jgi:HEAT repeat protein